ncbi:MAG: hypothetical protein ABF308_15375 [Phaeobacter gallaeciensis]
MKLPHFSTFVILGCLAIIAGATLPRGIDSALDYRVQKAVQSLPTSADYFSVTYADLARENETLVVYTDGRAVTPFKGRYRVVLRDRETGRHVFTPEWSDWIDYRAPEEVAYRQPETLFWWTGGKTTGALPVRHYIMETCWQAHIEDNDLGPVDLEPVCVTTKISE